MDIPSSSPEIGHIVSIDGVKTNLHDQGSGFPVLLIHGSGPGVTAWANWRLTLPVLAETRRVLAADMLGFGYTERPEDGVYNLERWVQQVLSILDFKGIERTDLIGNSYGGALALAFAIRYPERVRRLVLMGSVGVPFPITEGLNAVWGYIPSLERMKKMMDIFAYDRSLVTDELAQLRYEASIRPGFQESFAQLFPAPRQRWVDALASDEAAIRALPHETLIIHGRDDQVIPLATSQTLSQWIEHSQLHVFGCCGHWTQIEQRDRFNHLVEAFFAEADREEQ